MYFCLPPMSGSHLFARILNYYLWEHHCAARIFERWNVVKQYTAEWDENDINHDSGVSFLPSTIQKLIINDWDVDESTRMFKPYLTLIMPWKFQTGITSKMIRNSAALGIIKRPSWNHITVKSFEFSNFPI